MSTNKSEHLQLHLWEPGDSVLRTEFNENWEKIDASAAQAQADLTNGLADVQASLAVKHFAVGTYAGNDGTRTVALGFTPKVVLICNTMAVANIGNKIGMAVNGGTYDANAVTAGLISIVTNGFKVVNDSNYAMNSSTYSYHYLALG